MRQIASIGVAIAALTITALPVHADDQSISFAVGAIGGTSLPARRDVPQPQITSQAYGGYAQSGGYVQKNCGYSGGPKSPAWTCQ